MTIVRIRAVCANDKQVEVSVNGENTGSNFTLSNGELADRHVTGNVTVTLRETCKAVTSQPSEPLQMKRRSSDRA